MYFNTTKKVMNGGWNKYKVETSLKIPNPVGENIRKALGITNSENFYGVSWCIPYDIDPATYIFEIMNSSLSTNEINDRLASYFSSNNSSTAAYKKREVNSIFGNPKNKAGYYKPVDIMFNKKSTIVFWIDGTKTVVSIKDGDNPDPEAAVAQAIVKKLYGGTSTFHNTVSKYVRREANKIRDDISETEKKLEKARKDPKKNKKKIAKLIEKDDNLRMTLRTMGERYYE